MLECWELAGFGDSRSLFAQTPNPTGSLFTRRPRRSRAQGGTLLLALLAACVRGVVGRLASSPPAEYNSALRPAPKLLCWQWLSCREAERWRANVYSLLYFSDLPKGWPSALFTRRPRRSRSQGGTLLLALLAACVRGVVGRLASSPPAEYNSALRLASCQVQLGAPPGSMPSASRCFLGGSLRSPPAEYNSALRPVRVRCRC